MQRTSARVLADSVSEVGARLTTLEVTFPRFILAEFNTHRVFSRNSASSRAIPTYKVLQQVVYDPFIPDEFGGYQKGMQAGEPLEGREREEAESVWLAASSLAAHAAARLALGREVRATSWPEVLDELAHNEPTGTHKQLVNRLLEPFMWHTVIVTATEWSNFFNLRTHEDAQPEIQLAASLMEEALYDSEPKFVEPGYWHLPLITPEDYDETDDEMDLACVSAARCARVSYLTHGGRRGLVEDSALANRLMHSGHLSPFEHPATPLGNARMCGNLRSWKQYRKLIPGEADPLRAN